MHFGIGWEPHRSELFQACEGLTLTFTQDASVNHTRRQKQEQRISRAPGNGHERGPPDRRAGVCGPPENVFPGYAWVPSLTGQLCRLFSVVFQRRECPSQLGPRIHEETVVLHRRQAGAPSARGGRALDGRPPPCYQDTGTCSGPGPRCY